VQYLDLAAHLRGRLRCEARQWAEEDEQATRTLYERGRDTAATLTETARMGYRILAHTAGGSWGGMITHVGKDFLSMGTGDGSDVHLATAAAVFEVTGPAGATGRLESNGPPTLLARLRQLELASSTVTLLTTIRPTSKTAPPISGSLTVVGRGHVVVDRQDHGRWVTPLSVIAGVFVPGVCSIPKSDFHRQT